MGDFILSSQEDADFLVEGVPSTLEVGPGVRGLGGREETGLEGKKSENLSETLLFSLFSVGVLGSVTR